MSEKAARKSGKSLRPEITNEASESTTESLSLKPVTEAEAGVELFLEGHCTLCHSPLVSEYTEVSPQLEIEESTSCEKCGVRVRQKLHTLH